MLIHGIWYDVSLRPRRFSPCTVFCRLRALELGMGLFVSRVASKENLSDDPSREKYDLLQKLKAVWVEPHLDKQFRAPQAWESLSIIERRP